MQFSISSISNRGLVRSYNQDACWYLCSEGFMFMCVADGLGGHACGEKASQILIDTFKKDLDISLLKHNIGKIEIYMDRLIDKCNDEIFSYIGRYTECRGMGSTLVCGVVIGDRLFIGHIGDSRFYVVRDGEILYRTRDHTVVQELIDQGELLSSALEWDPRRHILSRCLGGYERVAPILEHHPVVELHTGDYLLLFSDGLYDMVGDRDIVKCVSGSGNVEEKGKGLVQMALDNGGLDNITIILAEARQ